MDSGHGQRFVLRVLGAEGAEYEVLDAPLVIGRDPGCDVPLASRYVSRRHARVTRDGDVVSVHEMGSANPILVNDIPIEGTRVLASGDTVRIADIVIDVLAGADPDATQVFSLAPRDEEETRSALTNTERSRISELVRMGGTVAILFTDLENSTRVTAQLGDTRAQDYLRTHNDLVREGFERYGGVEVKGFGDGFLVTFVSASAAVRAASTIQKSLERYNRQNEEWPIRVRMGLNVGEVISEAEDIFGTAVIMASRVMSRARAGEILLTQPIEAIIAATGEFQTSPRGQVKLKGFDRMHRIYALEWRVPEPSPGGIANDAD